MHGVSQPFKALSVLTLIFKNKSWSPRNLYNLWKRTAGPTSEDILFKKTSDATLFQQRWKSKAAVRAYHGDYIPEKVFKRWYLPDSLPDVRPRRQVFSGDNLDLELYARRKLKEKRQEEEIEEKGLAPVGSLMFSEVERRIDTIVFRSCFAHSIYEARRLIIHGDVKLNGKKVWALLSIYQSCFSFCSFQKHTNATTRLAPGDMISVNPEAIRFFKRPNGEYDDINGGENRKRLTPIVDEVADEAKIDEEQSLESPLEPPTTSEPPMEDEVADTAKTNEQTTESPAEPQTASDPPIEDEVADTAKTDSAESPLEPHTISESKTIPKPKAKSNKAPLTPFYLPPYASPWLFIPAYIEPSFATCSVVYVRHPTARPGYSEIPTPYDADGTLIRYAWEWYMQRRPRMRSKSQLSRMPEDRTKIPPMDVGEERRLLLLDVKPFRKGARKHSEFGSQ